MWQLFTVDNRWVCPYCLTVLKTSNDNREELVRHIAKHLASCERYQEGRCHHREAVVRQTLRENITWYLNNNKTWRIFDERDNTWWCPLTLRNVPTVVAKGGRLDKVAFEYIVAHLLPHFPFNSNDLHSHSQVMAARSRRESHPMEDAPETAISGPLERSGDSEEPASSTITMMLASEEKTADDIELTEEHMESESTAAGDDLGWMDDLGGTVPAASQDNDKSDLWWMDDVDESENDSGNAGEPNTDLIRARDVQQSLLGDHPEIPGYTFATRFISASEVSGDFYDFITLPDGRIGFAQGDVSGHGMQAGLIMSMAKKVFSIYAKLGGTPREVLAAVNDSLCEDLNGKMFVTMAYGILDPKDQIITWARAGHNPVLVFNKHDKSIKHIKPSGMVVGMKAGRIFASSVQEEVQEVRSGDLLLVFTDGISETMNRQGEEYGFERIEELLLQHGSRHPEEILDRILDSVRGFRGGTETQDDMTLMAMEVE